MTPETFDLAVIGGGSAGLVAVNIAAALGARVVLLDKERLGGECLWTGCVPSKSIIASAAAAHQTRQLTAFGLSGHLDPVDLRAVTDRVQGIIQSIAQTEDAVSLRKRGIDVRFGNVTFRSPQDVQVDGQTFRARRFLICTGSSPVVPPIDGLERIAYLTNETLFTLHTLPSHLLIVGGGPVGVEMAQVFRRFGAAVTLLTGERGLLPREDAESKMLIADVFAREGINVLRGRASRVSADDDGLLVGYTDPLAGVGVVRGDRLLVAVGRRPNVAGLGLENAGVRYDEQSGIAIDAYLRTSSPAIFACGDVTGPYHFTHAAGFQAATAVRNALFSRLQTKVRLDPMPWTTFTDPEVARVGQTEGEARRTHGAVLVLRATFAQTDRAVAEGQTEGFVKLIVTPWRGTILGAHIVGPRAGELIQEVTLAMRRGLGVRALADTIHVYPTLAMAVQQAALDFYRQWPMSRLARRPLRGLVRRT